jgi:hypothetical protein
MLWLTQVVPPSVVAITTAPAADPAFPMVDPTAQQADAVTQANPVRALTGAGRPTGVNVPSHGDPEAMVADEEDPPGDELLVHAPARRAITIAGTTRAGRGRRDGLVDRRTVIDAGVVSGDGGTLVLICVRVEW